MRSRGPIAPRLSYAETADVEARVQAHLPLLPPAIGEEEIAAVTETLEAASVTSGPRADELEQRFAEVTGAEHAVALASGTAAMHLALVGLGSVPATR